MYIKSEAILEIAGVEINSNTYDFSWNFESENPSFLSVSIPNLADDLKQKIKKGGRVVFSFGFNDEIGTLINGYVDKKESVWNNNVTELTNLKIVSVEQNGFAEISKSYTNKNSKYIISDIAKELGFIVKKIDLVKNTVFSNGYVAYGKGLVIIRKLVDNAGSSMDEDGNQLTIYNPNDDNKNDFYLINYETGLLKEPIETEEDGKGYNYIIECLANSNIKNGTVLRVEANNLKSYVKVIKYNLDNFVGSYYVQVLEV